MSLIELLLPLLESLIPTSFQVGLSSSSLINLDVVDWYSTPIEIYYYIL